MEAGAERDIIRPDGRYFLYGGQGSDMSQSKAKHVYNSIDVSDFPGATFSGKTSYSRGFWGKLMSIFIIARDVNDAANLGHQAGEKVRGEMKDPPTIITEKDTIYDEHPVGKGSDGFPLYYLEDTIIITTRKDQFGKVIGSETEIKMHKR